MVFGMLVTYFYFYLSFVIALNLFILFLAPYVELTGTSHIQSSSGLYCSIEYTSRGWISGERNHFKCYLRRNGGSSKEYVCKMEGQWSGKSTLTKYGSKTSEPFLDVTALTPAPMHVKDTEEQDEMENQSSKSPSVSTTTKLTQKEAIIIELKKFFSSNAPTTTTTKGKLTDDVKEVTKIEMRNDLSKKQLLYILLVSLLEEESDQSMLSILKSRDHLFKTVSSLH